jgi:putative endonuclease
MSQNNLSSHSWVVYILRCKDSTLYTGISKNAKKRVVTHNAGKGARYTKTRRPVVMVYVETGFTHGEALKREYKIKQLSKAKKEELISNQ